MNFCIRAKTFISILLRILDNLTCITAIFVSASAICLPRTWRM